MRTRILAIGAATALVLTGLAPASAAFADDLTVSGTVTLDGAAIGGIEVGWYDPTTDAAGETLADAAGAYTLTVASGHPFVLYAGIDHDPVPKNVNDHVEWRPTGGADYLGVFVGASGTDYLYQSLTSFTTSLTGQNIDLDKPGAITGTNAVLANRSIALENLDRGRLRTAKADATGHFEILGLVPGSYRLSRAGNAFGKSHLAAYLSPTITVAAGTTTTLDPVLEKTGSITGVVTNKGKPVKGVSVASYLDSAYGDADVTDAKGRYTLSNESPGTYDLYIEQGTDDGGLVNRRVLAAHRTATVTAGATTKLNLPVRKGGSVTGTIPATKLGGVRVFVVDKKGELAGGAYVVTSAKKATPFTIRAVETGAATVFVPAIAGKTYGSAPVTVRGGVATSVGTIALTKKTVSISGRVVGATKGTVGYSANTYSLPSGSAKVKNGRYTITGLLPIPGVVSLKVTKTRLGNPIDATPGSKDVTVRPGGKRPVLTGTLLAGVYPLQTARSSIWLPGRSLDIGAVSVKFGLLTGTRLVPGSGRIDLTTYDSDGPFVEDSPFYLKMPASVAKITLRAGKTTDLGTVQVEIRR